MQNRKPKGFMEKILAIDCETTGLAQGSLNPVYDTENNKRYQSIAWGLIVASATTFKPIEKLYVEIKWDGESEWSKQAEGVHGLSKKYLNEHGVDEISAIEQIGSLIMKHFGDGSVSLLGHNVATFDRYFLRDLFERNGIKLKISNRLIDTYSVGLCTLGTFNSDDLFESVGLPDRDPEKHNALTDTEYALESMRRIHVAFQNL